jgi:hypothetical protein
MRIQRDIINTVTIASVKEYLRVPIGFNAAGSGVHSGTATGLGGDLATGYVAASNGSTSVKGIRRLASPLFIQGGEAFRVKFLPPRGQIAGLSLPGNSPRIRFRTFLLGYHKRPVA